MSLREKVNLFIYRFAEKGLEIFLMNSEAGEYLNVPNSHAEESDKLSKISQTNNIIQLEQTTSNDGNIERNVAVEADWHEIPSLKHLLKEDVHFVADKLFQLLPDSEKGHYVSVKDAFKKVLPHQFQALKELKEILIEKNLTKFL
ncbi:MAG TPA: hypothetical protein VK590_05885 [Saprospiraceae bacterium]|nr:hypothetical protein [Saprospiraceae bacterium]